MARTSLDISAIEAEEALVDLEIETHRAAIDRLQKRIEELAVTKRVMAGIIAKMAGSDGADVTEVEDGVSREDYDDLLGVSGSSRKPEGIPTVPEMIGLILREAGKPLGPREMTQIIRGRWWPAVKGEDIGPIAWRMSKREELHRVEGKYSLPEEPSIEPDEFDVKHLI